MKNFVLQEAKKTIKSA